MEKALIYIVILEPMKPSVVKIFSSLIYVEYADDSTTATSFFISFTFLT